MIKALGFEFRVALGVIFGVLVISFGVCIGCIVVREIGFNDPIYELANDIVGYIASIIMFTCFILQMVGVVIKTLAESIEETKTV